MNALREDDIVAAISEIVDGDSNKRIVTGIGDDAAVWQPSRSHRSVITTDALIEGVHFTRATMSLSDVGWRAMVANLSDLAAMGARPVLATVVLGVASTTSREDILDVYRGLHACARESGLTIVGGDLTRSPVLTLTITAVGEVRPSNVKLRSGGFAGDVIAVTGALGASRAGLAVALGDVGLDGEYAAQAVLAHRRPQARVREGLWLGASRNVHAMMDCSDGLSTDLDRLCVASGVGALVRDVPIAPSARALADLRGDDPAAFALAGGEDFELLVTVKASAFEHLSARFEVRFGRPLLRVGTLRKAKGVALLKGGREEPLTRSGWDHFET